MTADPEVPAAPTDDDAAPPSEAGLDLDPDKAARTAHLLRTLQDRQAQGPPPAPEPESQEHPALRGLAREVGEDGVERVRFQGAWVAPEFVTDLYDQGRRLQEAAAATPAPDPAWQAEHQRLLDEFEQAAVDLLSDTRRRAFPGLSEEQGALLDELLLPYADRTFARMEWEGVGEEDLLTRITSVGRDLMGRVRDLFTLAAAQQLQDNARAADAHKVAPDGLPGVAQPEGMDIDSYLRLPGNKRRDLLHKAAAAANALRSPNG